MRRRALIAGLTGAAALSLAADGQESRRRVGVLPAAHLKQWRGGLTANARTFFFTR